MLSACVPSACAVSPRNSAVVIGVPISLDDVSGMVQAIFTCSSRFTQSLTLPRLSRISSPQPTRDPRAEQGEFVDPACELEQQENAESEQPKCHGGFIPKPARRRPWSRVVQRPGRPRSASAALQPRHTNQGSSPASSVPVHQLLLNGDWSEDLGDVNNAEVEVFCRSYAQKGARSLRLLILPMVFRPTESTMSTDRGHL